MKKFSITTKTGDKGYTHLFSGEQVLKNSPRLEAYGDLDELVSVLSLARNSLQDKTRKDDILFLQRSLFTIGAELATTPQKISRLKKRIDQPILKILEDKRTALEALVEIPNGFVIPGGHSIAASYLDYARAISRRCERKILELSEKKEFSNETLLIWMNRLSDYLYLLARFEEKKPLMVIDLLSTKEKEKVNKE